MTPNAFDIFSNSLSSMPFIYKRRNKHRGNGVDGRAGRGGLKGAGSKRKI